MPKTFLFFLAFKWRHLSSCCFSQFSFLLLIPCIQIMITFIVSAIVIVPMATVKILMIPMIISTSLLAMCLLLSITSLWKFTNNSRKSCIWCIFNQLSAKAFVIALLFWTDSSQFWNSLKRGGGYGAAFLVNKIENFKLSTISKQYEKLVTSGYSQAFKQAPCSTQLSGLKIIFKTDDLNHADTKLSRLI